LHAVKGLLVDDRFVLALELLAPMMNLAEIDPFLRK
jgi:hypothetical protein